MMSSTLYLIFLFPRTKSKLSILTVPTDLMYNYRFLLSNNKYRTQWFESINAECIFLDNNYGTRQAVITIGMEFTANVLNYVKSNLLVSIE